MKQALTHWMNRQKWLAIFVATCCLTLILTVVSPVFLTLSNMQSVLVQSSVTAIMAIGMTYIILTAGIDISVGAILFFTSALFAQTMLETGSYVLSFALAMLCATVLGALNGVLIVKFRISPLITTLATYSMYRGAAIHLTGAQNIPVPREMGYLGNGRLFGLPVPILILIVVFLFGLYLLNYTRFGVYVRALGNSERSATETGLPIQKVTVAAYAITGFLTGIAALVLLARVGGCNRGSASASNSP